jgi:hypothetical protein
VNRRNLKIINLSTHYKLGVSVRIKIESEREGENKSQANEESDMVICFTEVRFLQTYSLKRSPTPSELSP